MQKNKKVNSKIDLDKARSSLDKIYEIFKDISFNADELNKFRCPYKNSKNRCTAQFDCKNQHFIKNENLAICTGSDKLDYRNAWEM